MESLISRASINRKKGKKKKMSVSGDSTVQSNQSTASSEITVAMTLVTVVLLREENYIAYP